MRLRRIVIFIVTSVLVFVAGTAQARPRHSVRLGKTMQVKLFVGPTDDKVADLTVRPLLVDGEIREFTVGDPHDVTETTFVIQRAYRLNDALPQDSKRVAQWKWQKGGWLLADRASGRLTRLNLPEFDPFYSSAVWYRDYVAYCGISPDAEMLYAVIFRVGDKKPVLARELRRAKGGELPDSECAPPSWERDPMRVTFAPAGMQPVTFSVNGRIADPYVPSAASVPAAEREPASPAPADGPPR